ncbi:hypothetical protein [Streptomyces cinerochromogenes]|uniref:hypothetical protein n=1 Tax=Streptomyces cinerochromogenes TaxID=66422 RepID=UPI0033B58BC2
MLRVLGVLKVATVEQIQQASAPHLSYRHTDTLRNLTPIGLKAAARDLGRLVGEMGDPARGAGRTGALHPMTVNEAVIAFLRPKPDLAQLANEPADVRAAAQTAVDAPAGLGTIASYATEVALPAAGTWSSPGKGSAQADIVITAPEDGVPLLFRAAHGGGRGIHRGLERFTGQLAQAAVPTAHVHALTGFSRSTAEAARGRRPQPAPRSGWHGHRPTAGMRECPLEPEHRPG